MSNFLKVLPVALLLICACSKAEKKPRTRQTRAAVGQSANRLSAKKPQSRMLFAGQSANRLSAKKPQSRMLFAGQVDAVTKATPQIVPYVTARNNFFANAKPGAGLSGVVSQVKTAVVSVGIIETVNGGIQFRNTGSGVVINSQGYILTCHQAVEGNPSPKVVLFAADHKHQFDAQVIADDPQLNLALLKINSSQAFPSAFPGNPLLAEPGMWVFAMGSPDGLSQSVTPGVISSISRSVRVGDKIIKDLIQTNIKNTPSGYLGGPLFNTDGLVIGIHVAEGLVLPVNQAGFILKLAFPMETGFDNKPLITGTWAAQKTSFLSWLGADVLPLNSTISKQLNAPKKGVLINRVIKDSPAEEAGMRRGDVITKFGRSKVTSVSQLGRLVKRTKPGRTVSVSISRNGEETNFTVMIEKMPAGAGRLALPGKVFPRQVDWFGMELANLTPALLGQYGIAPDQPGVVVIGVGDATRRSTGIRMGDLIRKVNGKLLGDVDEFLALAGVIKEGGVLLDISRGGRPLYITLEMK